MKDIDSLIREKRGELSGKKRRIAKFILDNLLQVAFMTAAELAEITEVSESTVVRFAKDCGFEGYPELQEKIQDLVQRKLTTVNRLKKYHPHVKDKANPVVKTLLLDLHNLEDTLQNLDLEEVGEVIEKILAADKIVIVAFTIFSPLAEYLETVLRWVRDGVKAITSTPMVFYSELARLSENSLVIGLNFPRYSREIVECLQAAKREDITTVVITDSEFSPLAEHADHLLLGKCRILSYIDSFTAPISLIGAIGTALSLKLKEDSTQYLEKLEQLWEDHQIFYGDSYLDSGRK